MSGPGGRRISAPLLVLSVFGFGGYALLLPVVPLWVASGGSGALGAGASTGVLMVVTVATQPAVPWLLRRVGYRPVLATGLLLLGAPAPLTALSAELAPVLGLAAIRGVGFGLLTVAGSALVAELGSPRELGRATAMYGLAIGVPQLALLPAGVGMAARIGFGPVLVAGAAPLLGLAVLPLLPRLRAGAVEAVRPDPRPGGRIPGATGPVLAMLACATAQGGLITFLPLAHRSGSAAVPVALFGTAAGALAGRLVAGQLTDRRGWGGRLLLPGVGCGVAGMVAEVVAVWPGVEPGTGVAVLVAAGAVLVGAGFGLVQNDSLVALFAAASPARYGGASALWNITYDAGTGAGAVGLGAIAQGLGYPATFAASALALALVAPAVPSRRVRRDA